MVNVSSKGSCRYKAANLAENGQVSNRVQYIELLEWICLLLKDENLLVLLKFEISLIWDLKFALVCPHSLQSFNHKLIRVVDDVWPAKLNHVVLFDEGDKWKDHIYNRYFIVDIEQDIDIFLNVLNDVVKQRLRKKN